MFIPFVLGTIIGANSPFSNPVDIELGNRKTVCVNNEIFICNHYRIYNSIFKSFLMTYYGINNTYTKGYRSFYIRSVNYQK